MKYCLHCDWYTSKTDGRDRDNQSRKALDHFLDTGHSIETVDSSPAPKEILGSNLLLRKSKNE
ncbi:hypothetical protein HALLA_00970 (plasmid) [Halostagnicola larsenii XH-48]|uniref:Uncharacterized protein n=1 Tax=Halostagnicola larsenii XH-48 TaxID=797299 RepID=W0JX86_9EURY|nr:hypothetical protein HALLA_00970 [Halostagnicola larsenii XH-48]